MRRTDVASRVACLLGLGILLAVGCEGGTNLAGDGGPGDGRVDEAGDDAAVREDVGHPDDTGGSDASCVTPSHWELAPRTIDNVMSWGTSRLGATDRLRIEVQMLSACDRLGRVDVEAMPGDATDRVTIRAYAWQPTGLSCPPSAPLVPWTVEIEGRQQGNIRVVVADGNSPGGGLRLEYEREACAGGPECACSAGDPPGTGVEWADCLTDCSCAAGLSCIGSYGLAGPTWSCLRGCNDFLDCAFAEQCVEPVPDGVPLVCLMGDQCDDGTPCPDGFECMRDTMDAPNSCADRREPSTMRSCSCDEPCGTGQLCLLGMRAEPTCDIPCLRSVDCPDRGTETWVCGTAGICVPLE